MILKIIPINFAKKMDREREKKINQNNKTDELEPRTHFNLYMKQSHKINKFYL